jgi:hypothetical protein
LHRATGQADLAALDFAPLCQLQIHPGILDRIGVGHCHQREILTETANLMAKLFGMVQSFSCSRVVTWGQLSAF